MFTHCQLFYVSIIIPVTRVRVVVGGGDYILKAIIIITIFMPVTAYVFFNSKYFRPLKLKRIRFAIYFAVLLIYLFLIYMLGYYVVSNAVK